MTATHVCKYCSTPHDASTCTDESHDHDDQGDKLPRGEVDLLRYLAVLCEDRKAMEKDERAAVERLRLLDVSWSKIALRLDTPKTTLLRRYAYLDS